MDSIPTQDLRQNLPSLDLLHQLSDFANERGLQLYLVGGSVRDLLLNRTITDLDFALRHDAVSFAKAFADRVDGAFIPLEEHPPTARIVIRETRLTLDFVEFRAESLEADLCLRDLTINSIALDFSVLLTQPSVNLIDPCNGLQDLKSRLLRFPSEQVVLDDPLRLLRVYRFATQLGFEIPDTTIHLIKKHKDRLPQVSVERIRDEFMKLLDVQNAATYVHRMDEIGILSQIVPEIEGMRNYSHHPDVWRYALRALEMFETKPVPNLLQPYQEEIQEYLNQHIVYDKRRKSIIKLALLLHGVAKPLMKANGLQVGREKIGAEMAGAIVKRLRLGGKVAKLTNCLVRNQLNLGNLVNAENLTRRELIQFLRNTKEDWLGVILLSYADLRTSQREECLTKTVGIMKQIADLYYQEIRPMMTRGRLITGDEIMQTFGLKPGVKVGRILKHIEDLQFDGNIHTPQDALEATRQFLDAS